MAYVRWVWCVALPLRPCVLPCLLEAVRSVECLTFLSVGAFVVEIARVGGGHAIEQAASELVAGLDLNAIEA